MVDYQNGDCGPLPVWARAMMAAEEHGAPVWDLLKQPDWEFWMEAGLLMRSIKHEADDRARKKSKT